MKINEQNLCFFLYLLFVFSLLVNFSFSMILFEEFVHSLKEVLVGENIDVEMIFDNLHQVMIEDQHEIVLILFQLDLLKELIYLNLHFSFSLLENRFSKQTFLYFYSRDRFTLSFFSGLLVDFFFDPFSSFCSPGGQYSV